MKLAFSSNAFRRYSLIDTIEALAAVGYQGIEIMADVPHAYPPHLNGRALGKIRRVLDRNRMEVSNINAFMLHAEGDTYHPSWIEKDPEARQKRIAHTLRCIDLASLLGARTLSTEPGGPLQGMSFEEGMRLFREGLMAVRDKAAEKGIRILIEPEPGLLIENSRQFLALFEELDPGVFGLNFDIGHFFCVGEECPLLIHELKGMIHHFHLEDIPATREHFHRMPGEGAIDLAGVLRAIRGTGYDGFVTVELYPYEEKPVVASWNALEYLKKIV
ncbi:MAG: sugar phosphate isomerase/epimerase [Alphaproteobacteria bacterium]|uniref:Sugar phosphate isomerase/epimerase n=1 Tax=Candidatus Nitrobium versatile TaxID=2884831 RepID=A0A953M344_9BACT|nr:sugar phosphate isomerase/epimerase [Candidatus Nitrobium versatile]